MQSRVDWVEESTAKGASLSRMRVVALTVPPPCEGGKEEWRARLNCATKSAGMKEVGATPTLHHLSLAPRNHARPISKSKAVRSLCVMPRKA